MTDAQQGTIRHKPEALSDKTKERQPQPLDWSQIEPPGSKSFPTRSLVPVGEEAKVRHLDVPPLSGYGTEGRVTGRANYRYSAFELGGDSWESPLVKVTQPSTGEDRKAAAERIEQKSFLSQEAGQENRKKLIEALTAGDPQKFSQALATMSGDPNFKLFLNEVSSRTPARMEVGENGKVYMALQGSSRFLEFDPKSGQYEAHTMSPFEHLKPGETASTLMGQISEEVTRNALGKPSSRMTEQMRGLESGALGGLSEASKEFAAKWSQAAKQLGKENAFDQINKDLIAYMQRAYRAGLDPETVVEGINRLLPEGQGIELRRSSPGIESPQALTSPGSTSEGYVLRHVLPGYNGGPWRSGEAPFYLRREKIRVMD